MLSQLLTDKHFLLIFSPFFCSVILSNSIILFFLFYYYNFMKVKHREQNFVLFDVLFGLLCPGKKKNVNRKV